MTELISQAEYARRRGVSKVAVNIAIKAGRITLTDGKIDPEKADAEWARNSRPRVNSVPSTSKKMAPAARAPIQPTAPPVTPVTPVASVPIDLRADTPPWQESKARQAAIDADKAEIELAKMVGALVDAATVRAEFSRRISAVREGLLQLPARLAPILTGENSLSVVQTTLDTELRAVLEQFAVA